MLSVVPWKAVIVDPSRDQCETYARALEPDFRATCCTRGDEALARLLEEKPDILIMELSLVGLDGISLLRKLSERPPVLVISDLLSPYAIGALEDLGVQYVLRKPAKLTDVLDRALELTYLGRGFRNTGNTLEVLRRLNIPSGRQGFQHLLIAIPMLTGRRDQRLGKELYAEIARQCGTTAAAVEKGIRDALRAGWEQGDRALWQKYFPGTTQCPRNKEFLFRMADLLNSWRRCG